MNSTLVAFASRQEFNTVFPQISAVVAGSTPVAVGTLYDVTVCGVGSVNFAANLAYQLSQRKYARVFLVGVCGAYTGRGFSVGEVVRIDSEVVGDMGAQDRDGHFLSWGEISGDQSKLQAESARFLPIGLASLRSAAGVTVNCCTGTQYLGVRRANLFNADVETMEGAAGFVVCKRFGVPVFQFRAVSNIASDRDPASWKMSEALVALKEAVLRPEFFEE